MASWPYNTARWQRLRERKLSRDPLCQCERCEVLDENVLADEVDHIKPIERGGEPFAWDNLRSMAQAHHSAKTYHVDQRGKASVPIKGADPETGLPLDPNHWWRAKNL